MRRRPPLKIVLNLSRLEIKGLEKEAKSCARVIKQFANRGEIPPPEDFERTESKIFYEYTLIAQVPVT